MNQIYIFLIEWDIPIYFFSAVGILISLYQLFRARRILRQAMFTLERETGERIRNNASIALISLTAVLGGVIYFNLQVVPTLPQELLRPPTPTPNMFATPLSSPTPLSPNEFEGTPRPRTTPNLVPTVTLAGGLEVPAPAPVVSTRTPTPEEEENGPEVITGGGDGFIPNGGGCTPAVSISQPRPNTTIFGTVEFFGTATDPNFGFYLLEIRGSATNNQWVNILGDNMITQVNNGPLGAVNIGTLPNDIYEVRLSVLNNAGQQTGQCIITVTIENP